jgi:hypothetical protein
MNISPKNIISRFNMLVLMFSSAFAMQAQTTPWSIGGIGGNQAILNLPSIQGPTSSGGGVQILNANGSLIMGPQNGAWCHMTTDRPSFYFNTMLTLGTGILSSYYTTDLNFQTGTSTYGALTRMTIQNSTGFVGIGTTTPIMPLDINTLPAPGGRMAIMHNGNSIMQFLVKSCNTCYNGLAQDNDNGIIWSDNGNSTNFSSGFVIAPWNGFGGIRIDGLTGSMSVSNRLSVGSLIESAQNNYGTSFLGFNATPTGSGIWTCQSDGVHNGAATIYADINGITRFIGIPNSSSNANVTQTLTDAQIFSKTTMSIQPTGQVLIGNQAAQTPGPYKLYVFGGIMTELVKIALVNSSSWADYVFADKYKLIPLSEVERFVKLNKHLPEVPSAQEVQTNGINVAEMDATLLKKVEELTLYIIELNKKIEALEKKDTGK